MALVSAGGMDMGEAVLGYGDGIASEVVKKVQDGGGVFAGVKTDEITVAKEIRLGRELNGTENEGRRGVLMEDPDAHVDGVDLMRRSNLVTVRLETEILSKAAAGHATTNGTCVHWEDACGAGTAVSVNGRSHADDLGSPDHLVEMAIKFLDEKVIRPGGHAYFSPLN